MADLQHTPTPWSIGRRRWITGGNVDIARIHSVSKIGEAEAVANAEFIIRACNSHDALLSALEMALRMMEAEGLDEQFDGEAEVIRDAIAKAKGGA